MVLDFGLHVPTSAIVHEFVATSRPFSTVENNGKRFSSLGSRGGAYATHNLHTRCNHIAFTTASMSTLRFLPPFFAAGISPDSSFHCSEVKLLGYDGLMALVTLSYLSIFSNDRIPLRGLSYFSDIL